MNRKKAILLLIAASILWSTGGIFIKMVSMNPIAIAGARSGIAAVIMFLYLRKPITDFNSKKIIGALFYASLTILFCSANKLTTSANAILLQFTAPIWVVLFSKWFLKEKIHKSDWISIVFVFCGMILFFLGSINMGHIAGNLIAILSGVAMAGMVIMLKLQKNGSPVEMTLLGNIFVFIIGLPFILRSTPNKSSIMGLIVLGIFQLGISYIMYATSVKYVSSLEAVLITVLEPLLNPVWVFIFSGEAPGKFAFLGGAIVLVTVILKSIYQQKIYAEDQSSIEKAAD